MIKPSSQKKRSYGQKIFDCFEGAFRNQTDVTEGNRQFIENLERSFPGVNLLQAKLLLPPAQGKEAANEKKS
jgi:hypothetical protein